MKKLNFVLKKHGMVKSSSAVMKKVKKALPAGAILLCVLLSNFATLFFTHANPIYKSFNDSRKHFMNLPILSVDNIECNDFLTKFQLGHQAAEQISQGVLPLWNSFEGVGVPLLGETQSAALFPFTMLFLIPAGWLIYHILLQFIGGYGAYLFVVKLLEYIYRKGENSASFNESRAKNIGITAGCLFATVGTFVLLRNACLNPIAFLPWSMLGVLGIVGQKITLPEKEKLAQNLKASIALSLSLILGLLSGFPETFILNGTLIFAFGLVLLYQTKQIKQLRFIIASTVVALMVASPWVLEFVNYLHNGAFGGHSVSGFQKASFNNNGTAYLQHFIPDIIGFTSFPKGSAFGDVGGYFMMSTMFLMILGFASKSVPKWSKLLFGGFFAVYFLRIMGNPIVIAIFSLLPEIGSIAIHRYATPLMEFCVIVVASIFFYKSEIRRKTLHQLFLVFTVCYLGMLYGNKTQIHEFISTLGHFKGLVWVGFWLSLSLFAFIACFFFVRVQNSSQNTPHNARQSALQDKGEPQNQVQDVTSKKSNILKRVNWQKIVCFILIAESTLCFAVWGFGGVVKSESLDTRPLDYIKENVGNSRFVPEGYGVSNIGSYFNIASTTYYDLPSSKTFLEYLEEKCPESITSDHLSKDTTLSCLDMEAELGARYVEVPVNKDISELIAKHDLKKVYEDERFKIYEMSNYTPYFSNVSENNDVNLYNADYSRDELTTNSQQAFTLKRLELYYPGWHAYIDGNEVPIEAIAPADANVKLFQSVEIPAGKHEVKFVYWPANMTLCVILALLGLLTIVVGCGSVVFLRQRNLR